MHPSWSPSQIIFSHLVLILNCPRSRIKPMCCVVPFPNMTHCTELCVWIFSWPICVVNTQRAWSGVCFNSVCPCYFRVTLSCENTAGKKHAKHKRAPSTCFSSLCLFTRTPGHLYKSFQRMEKSFTIWERNVSFVLVSASHLGMIKHWQGESDEAVAIIRTMTSTNCNHCRDEAHNQKLLESARKMSSQSGATWGGESFNLTFWDKFA